MATYRFPAEKKTLKNSTLLNKEFFNRNLETYALCFSLLAIFRVLVKYVLYKR